METRAFNLDGEGAGAGDELDQRGRCGLLSDLREAVCEAYRVLVGPVLLRCVLGGVFSDSLAHADEERMGWRFFSPWSCYECMEPGWSAATFLHPDSLFPRLSILNEW